MRVISMATGISLLALFFLAPSILAEPACFQVSLTSVTPSKVYVDGLYSGLSTPATVGLSCGEHRIGIGGDNNRYQDTLVNSINGSTQNLSFQDSGWYSAKQWRILLLAVRHTDLGSGIGGGQQAILSDNDILLAQTALAYTNANWVQPFSYNLASWQIETLIVENTLGHVGTDWDQLDSGRLLTDSGLTSLPNQYDSIFFFWPSVPEGGVDPWGGCRGVGGGYSMTIPNACVRYATLSEIWIHEWLHPIEGFYSSLGYDMGLEGLHGAEEHGYSGGVEGEWLHWYRDFMRGQVLESKGSSSYYVAIPPNAWLQSTRLEIMEDQTPPTGNILSPYDGSATGNASFSINAVADDNPGGSGVNRVEFFAAYDDAWHFLCSDTSAPYVCNWTADSISDQTIIFTIHVIDNAGSRTMDPGGYRYVTLDRIAPTGFITSPQSGSIATGTDFIVSADANDSPGGSGVNRVEFFAYFDGNWHPICNVTDVSYPSSYVCSWSEIGLSNEYVMFTIHVVDNAGNRVMDPGGYTTVYVSQMQYVFIPMLSR